MLKGLRAKFIFGIKLRNDENNIDIIIMDCSITNNECWIIEHCIFRDK